ncbi:hypothetical protein MACH05_23690 [Qipengyuania nanhaisediminis]
MQPEEAPPEPDYAGPYVVIEPEGPLYRVEVRPTPDGGPRLELFACKSAAWGEMLALAVGLGLPPLDLCNGKILDKSERK